MIEHAKKLGAAMWVRIALLAVACLFALVGITGA